jgi:L-fucose dehydrogenase
MDLQLKDKVIIVSGGAKGIGEGIVKVLAGEGAIPVIAGRNEADNKELVAAIESAGGKAFQVVAELSLPEESEKVVNYFRKIWVH